MFYDNIASSHHAHQSDSDHVDNDDVQHFLTEYVVDRLWDSRPGRHHEGFANARHAWKINNCGNFAAKLSSLSCKLDLWRKFLDV